MGQVRHGSATTTHAVKAAIQRSQAPLSQRGSELGINPKTVANWHKRATVEDMKAGPPEPSSTVLNKARKAMIVAFPKAHKAAAGRLPSCPQAFDPAPDAVSVAPVPAASRESARPSCKPGL